MLGQLIPLGGGDPIPLKKPMLLVGRRPSCDIRLDLSNVSSQHCELAFVNGYWRVRDLHSSNGTKVNGERVDEKFVQPGDTIAFAKSQFEIEYTPDPHAAPPEEVDPFAISLLEKAGLAGWSDNSRPRRTAPPKDDGSQNGQGPNGKKPAQLPPRGEPDDDDKALEWMSDE